MAFYGQLSALSGEIRYAIAPYSPDPNSAPVAQDLPDTPSLIEGSMANRSK